MKFINHIMFPTNDMLVSYMEEHSFEDWPFKVFLDRGLKSMSLDDITIFYGNNGSGKSTLLNCLSEKIGAARNKPLFIEKKWSDTTSIYYPFHDYVNSIRIDLGYDSETGYKLNNLPSNIRLITSDDIFSRINNTIRSNNIRMDEKDAALEEYYSLQENNRLESLDKFDEFERSMKVRRKSMTAARYIRENSRKQLEIHSNGETAIEYFESVFDPDGIYLLDEPENCLSPLFQIELVKMIVNAKRFFNCQFIIATHSPIILGIPDALVYDLDSNPVCVREWQDLDNVRVYYDFFMKNKNRFEKKNDK